MSLNIKSEEAEELARTLAQATGESLTGAITVALRERLERLTELDGTARRQRAARLRQISADAGPRWTAEYRTTEHGEMLYDDAGLPR
jgi:antitoxin VapB